MKTITLAALALALPLSISNAWANEFTPLPESVLSDPNANSTTIDDGNASTSATIWSSSFDLSKLSFASIYTIELTIKYSGIANVGSEKWFVHTNGSTGTTSTGLLVATPKDPKSQTVTFSSVSNPLIFENMIKNGKVSYWFTEGTTDQNSFVLNSAKLSVVGAVPEPESYAMLLAGLAMMGTIARRRNKNS